MPERQKLRTEKEEIEYSRKTTVIETLLDIYNRELKDGSISLILKSLEKYSAQSLEEAARIYIRNQKFFSVAELLDIVVEFELDSGPVLSPVVSTDAQKIALRKHLEECDIDED